MESWMRYSLLFIFTIKLSSGNDNQPNCRNFLSHDVRPDVTVGTSSVFVKLLPPKAVSEATSFYSYQLTNSQNQQERCRNFTSSVNIADLQSNASYKLTVYKLQQTNATAWSNCTAFECNFTTCTLIPGVGHLRQRSFTSTSIALVWIPFKNTSSEELTYIITWSSGGKNCCYSTANASANITDLHPNTTYKFHVQAKIGFSCGKKKSHLASTKEGIDECTDINSCHENAYCTDTTGSCVCSCNDECTGNDFVYENVDECTSKDSCHENASFTDNNGSYVCSCNDGFTGNGSVCENIDECTNMNRCHESSSCVDNVGSYLCSCNDGFTGNGSMCENIDECTGTVPCHENASCSDTIGSFVCTCNPGFIGDGSICKNSDECSTMNLCHENATCMDTVGSFICNCDSGYISNGSHCIDVNECEDKDANNCNINANCTNEPGSFSCKCNPGFTGDGGRCKGRFCDKAEAIEKGVKYTFNKTLLELMAYSNERCSSGVPKASILCIYSAEKKSNQFSRSTLFPIDCKYAQLETIIANTNLSNITTKDLQNNISALDLVTSESSNITEIKGVATFLSHLSANISGIEVSDESYRKIVSVANHVTEAMDNITSTSNLTSNQAAVHIVTDVLRSLVVVGTSIDLSNTTNSNFTVLTPRIAAQVLDRKTNVSLKYELRICSNVTHGEMIQPVSISIPSEALQRAAELENGSNTNRPENTVRVVNILQGTRSFFSPTELGNWVVSVDINLMNITNLEQTINITHYPMNITSMKSNQPHNSQGYSVNQTCVFWNLTLNEWSTDGCRLVRDSNPPVCRCNHLTSFALLLRTDSVPPNTILDNISMVGCILSVMCLGITIIFQLISQKRHYRRSVSVSINYCVNTLVFYIIFLAGVNQRKELSMCFVIALVLNYFLLSACLWTAVYAHLLYMSFVKIFSSLCSKYMVKAYVLSYGSPVIIVSLNATITLLLSSTSGISEAISTFVAEDFCWLRGNALYFSFVLPVGLVLIFNSAIFYLVLRKVTWKRKQVPSNLPFKQTLHHQFSVAATIACSLGLTWILGFIMMTCPGQTCRDITSWLFSITGSFQGFFIFLLVCVKNKDIRNVWWPHLRSVCLFCKPGSASQYGVYSASNQTEMTNQDASNIAVTRYEKGKLGSRKVIKSTTTDQQLCLR